ncbi:hypothetical protein ACJ73_00591 [Blastomyces percursus]|uniref:SAM domain-containing protein n=1 Tax=Blastomyces percursus TaxID=1658174 RepID=A0A1J9RJ55_9EURO|nr:hypothetical protein ACJ73_00591 [Blastomyces percursus]
MSCHNFEQGTCWIAYDDTHIQLLSSEIASWIDDIERGKAIVETPSIKMTRRLMDRKEKKNQKKDEPTTITNSSIQTPQMPAVIFSPSIPAAPASTSSNTAFPSEIINVMMMKCMMEGMGGLNSKPQSHYYLPSNPPSNLPSNPLSNPLDPPSKSSAKSPSNSSSNSPSELPSNLPSIRSSPVPQFGEHAGLFFNEYFDWLTRWRLHKASGILDAKFSIQNEGFELDHLRTLTKEQLIDMNIGQGIYRIIKMG